MDEGSKGTTQKENLRRSPRNLFPSSSNNPIPDIEVLEVLNIPPLASQPPPSNKPKSKPNPPPSTYREKLPIRKNKSGIPLSTPSPPPQRPAKSTPRVKHVARRSVTPRFKKPVSQPRVDPEETVDPAPPPPVSKPKAAKDKAKAKAPPTPPSPVSKPKKSKGKKKIKPKPKPKPKPKARKLVFEDDSSDDSDIHQLSKVKSMNPREKGEAHCKRTLLLNFIGLKGLSLKALHREASIFLKLQLLTCLKH